MVAEGDGQGALGSFTLPYRSVMLKRMPVPPLVVLIRHAQSGHHVQGLTGGWTNTPLTELGHQQAHRLAARLKAELGETPIRLYTSDLVRCAETAAPIATALGVVPISDARLREHNNGAAAHLTVAEARARFPETFDAFWGMDLRPYPGAETWAEFYTRGAAFLEALPADGPVPVLVSHGGTIMTLTAAWLRLDLQTVERTWFAVHPTSISVFQSDRWDRRGIERLNDAAHLAGTEGWVRLPV